MESYPLSHVYKQRVLEWQRPVALGAAASGRNTPRWHVCHRCTPTAALRHSPSLRPTIRPWRDRRTGRPAQATVLSTARHGRTNSAKRHGAASSGRQSPCDTAQRTNCCSQYRRVCCAAFIPKSFRGAAGRAVGASSLDRHRAILQVYSAAASHLAEALLFVLLGLLFWLLPR